MSTLRLVVFVVVGGCNLKQVAMRSLADTVAEPGKVYARDDNPEFVRDATPVMLKIMEQLHDGLPTHKPLLLAMVRGFTSYGAAFMKPEAERTDETSVVRAREMYAQCRRMFVRARDYGLKGLDLAVPGLSKQLHDRAARDKILQQVKKQDVGLLYWTAAAWALAVSSAKNDMKLVGDLPKAEAFMRRALELDEAYEEGAIHEFFIVYAAARSEHEGGGRKRAKAHFERALALSKNKSLSAYVNMAEAYVEAPQDKAQFVRLLEQVAKTDVDADLDRRLVNVLAVRRAKWLLSRTGDFFVD